MAIGILQVDPWGDCARFECAVDYQNVDLYAGPSILLCGLPPVGGAPGQEKMRNSARNRTK
jgi:hypothetical protein